MTARAAGTRPRPTGAPSRSPERAVARAFAVAARRLVEDEAARRAGPGAARDAAFAWVHLVAALRMMEARGLVGGSAVRGARSGRRRGAFPPIDTRRDDAGCGRDLARLAEIEIGGAIARGARAYEPAPATLRALAALASRPELDASWLRDDALGNVFQDFSELERAKAWERLAAGRELGAGAIPAATRIFTPRWIVRALLENSLGRLWLSMHPDSSLRRSMRYLVSRGDLPRAEPKPASAITFLDPACGTMHFGLDAFGLFEAMHREERANAGRDGWPRRDLVALPHRVAETILDTNVAGADVDAESIEIAAVALRIRARRAEPGLAPRPLVRLAVVDGGAPGVGSLRALPASLPAESDVVATNPPYLGRRHLPPALRESLRSEFEEARGDLCAAFVLRALSLLRAGGRAALIAQQSFLFTSGYERLRRRLREEVAPEVVVHLGPRAFEEVGGEKVSSALVVLRRDGDRSAREGTPTVFLRAVEEKGPEPKRRRVEAALDRLRAGEPDPIVHRARIGEFDAIPGAPWSYAMSPDFRRLFATRAPLAAVADVRQGLATTDNARFVRHWYEVGHRDVAWDCSNGDAASRSGKRWFPYAKGGGARRWLGRIDLVVDWEHDGAAVKRAIAKRYPYLLGNWKWVAKNSDHYFRGGITYSALSPGRFSARLLPRGAVFDVAGSAVFAHGSPEDELFLLGILNSSIAGSVLALLNPTVNVQVGDLERLPVPPRGRSTRLVDLVTEAVALARATGEEDETDPAFVAPPDSAAAVRARAARLRQVEETIDREAARLYGVARSDRARPSESAPIASDWAASEEGVAHRWLSYAVGIALGRYTPGAGVEPGRGRATAAVSAKLRDRSAAAGLLPLEGATGSDLASRILEILGCLRGAAGAERIARTAAGALGKPLSALRAHLASAFYRRHVRVFRSRPVYAYFRPRSTKAASFYACVDRLDRALLETAARSIGAGEWTSTESGPEVGAFARRLATLASRGEIPSRDEGTLPRLEALRRILADREPDPC